MNTKYADRPFITMSMSGTGVISRLAGAVFGSACTFGAGVAASAPGQIPVNELRNVLEIIHKNG
jgi:3-dehydroquinate dehydratase I